MPPAQAPYADVGAMRAELTGIDMRLAEIRRERPGLAGPITLTAVGGGVAFATAYIGLLTWIIAEEDGYCDGYESYDCYDDDDEERRIARGFAVASLGGLAASIGGIVWMSRRLKQRQAYKPEINQLRLRRRQLLQDLRYGFNAEPGRSYALSLRAAF
jgi:hypothetical protein